MPTTVNQSRTLTVVITAVRPLASGDVEIAIQFLDAGGVPQGQKTLLLRADGSGVYDGPTQLTATTPATFMLNMTTLISQANTSLASFASAGKLAP